MISCKEENSKVATIVEAFKNFRKTNTFLMNKITYKLYYDD